MLLWGPGIAVQGIRKGQSCWESLTRTRSRPICQAILPHGTTAHLPHVLNHVICPWSRSFWNSEIIYMHDIYMYQYQYISIVLHTGKRFQIFRSASDPSIADVKATPKLGTIITSASRESLWFVWKPARRHNAALAFKHIECYWTLNFLLTSRRIRVGPRQVFLRTQLSQ